MGLNLERTEILLLVAAIVAMLARRLRLPYTIGLVLAGTALAFLPTVPADLTLTRRLIYSAFLPPLIFEGALQIHWPALRRDLPVIMTLATVGVLLSAAVTAAGARFLIGWPWSAAVLVAVLLSATDPVSVIATFRELGVMGRLRLLVEAESLFNDGTVAVLFTVALAAVTGAASTPIGVAWNFLVVFGGGILCGLVVGAAVLVMAGRTDDHLVEITFSTIAAFGSFTLAEQLGMSGVLASMTAGILLGNTGSVGAFTDRGREAVESFWEYVGFVANSLIFLLIGISLSHEHFGMAWKASLAFIALITVGRAVAVYGCAAFFARSRHRVEVNHQHLLFWGGLRGALALALVFGLPPDMPYRQAMVTVTFAVVAFSIVVQGLTMIPLLRFLRQCEPEAEAPAREAAGAD